MHWFNWGAREIAIRRNGNLIAYMWLWNLFNRVSTDGHFWGVGVLQIQNRHLSYIGSNGISICFIGRTR
jgi:hypothetical protein